MSHIFIAIYTFGAIISWPLNASAQYAYFQKDFPAIADSARADDAAFAILLGFVFAMTWPLGDLTVFILSERYRHGLLFPGTKPRNAVKEVEVAQ